MPKVAILQQSFNTGEVSPLYYGRVSEERYKASMTKALNYIPTLQGPVIRRPGTKFLNAVKDSNNPPILIPFTYSLTQTYMLEFGDKYVRFYTNNGQVTNPNTYYQVTSNLGFFTRADQNPIAGEFQTASPGPFPNPTYTEVTGPAVLELVTPYAIADVAMLKWAQDKNTLYIVHPNYTPMTLKLLDNTGYQWGIEYFDNTDGPYLQMNTILTEADGARISLYPSRTKGDVQPGIALGIMTLTAGPPITISGAADNGAGLIRITATAHGYQNGDHVFISGVAGTVEANNVAIGTSGATFWKVIAITVDTFDLIGSTFVNAYISNGIVTPAPFLDSPDVSGGITDLGRQLAIIGSDSKRYTGRINPDLGSGVRFVTNEVTWIVDPTLTLPDTDGCAFWFMGTWIPTTLTSTGAVNKGSFPSCVTFHQDRLVFSGCPSAPQEIDASQPGTYTSFQPSDPATLDVAANNALQFTLLSRQANTIRWLASSAQGLLAGGYDAEWAITPDSSSAVLAPTNINALQTSFFGSAASDAIQLGNATLYVQRSQRKLREMNFFFQVGTFRSTDLSELSEHITIPAIIKLAVQKETQPLVWSLRSDGQLLTMVYNRDDTTIKAGWSRHQLGGQSDSAGTPPAVLSIGVIPDPTVSFDQLWLVVQRYINGAKISCIEYLTRPFDDSMLQEDAFQGDCGATFDNPKVITGITNASPAVVTSNSHGFSNGNQVKITNITGLNLSTTDQDGITTVSNFADEKTFYIAGVTTNTFQLVDENGAAVSSVGYSAYVSGGQVRKMVTSITGLTWLENETISVLADGSIHPDVVVSNSGGITLNYPAAKVQIGYGFNSDGQLPRLEAGAADGTSIGKTRRANRLAFMLHNVGDLLVGMSFDRLTPCEFTQSEVNQADIAAPLFSGIIRDSVGSEYDYDGQVCFRQNSMLPGCIQAVTIFMEEQDV